jgi:tetratricopeptide (TPR) repeat protein
VSVPPPNERRVIPRWRSYRATLALGELTPLRAGTPRPWSEGVEQREARGEAFRAARTAPHAADLVGSALVLGPSAVALDAARSLVSGQLLGSPLAQTAARVVLARASGSVQRSSIDELDEHEHDRQLAELRVRLKASPANAVRWADLARLYTIIARPKKAQQAMRVAMALAREDRYVLRSAARLAVHQREYDRAHAILARARVTPTDPWLVASEIAVADLSGGRSTLVRRARDMLADTRYSPFEVNELASAIATLELQSGDRRASRRLFRRALECPTDNTLAQVAWARPILGLDLDEQVFQAPGSWEARALAAHQRGDWRESTTESERWQDDQPFASRPAELGSYEASKGGDYELGARFAERGLKTNPEEFLLRNNAAFCLLSEGKIDRARPHLEVIAKLKLTRQQRSTALATQGLFFYRRGDRETGLARYSEAIRTAGDRHSRALARLMLAREELLYGSTTALELLAAARRAAEEADPHELKPWMDQVEASLPIRPGTR